MLNKERLGDLCDICDRIICCQATSETLDNLYFFRDIPAQGYVN